MKTIYLIENDKHMAESLQLILDNSGYRVLVFADGNNIINNAFAEPDVFIIDKQLIGMDGLEICRFLKNRATFSSTPVIVYSASPRIFSFAREAGADGCLEKPFKTRELIWLIEGLTMNQRPAKAH